MLAVRLLLNPTEKVGKMHEQKIELCHVHKNPNNPCRKDKESAYCKKTSSSKYNNRRKSRDLSHPTTTTSKNTTIEKIESKSGHRPFKLDEHLIDPLNRGECYLDAHDQWSLRGKWGCWKTRDVESEECNENALQSTPLITISDYSCQSNEVLVDPSLDDIARYMSAKRRLSTCSTCSSLSSLSWDEEMTSNDFGDRSEIEMGDGN
ncbi:uncharacterized protein LOC106471040 isoform X1 [Limulus polyphemus]|uniref:Uncharacterized protein LOC106471040 isoform X1 n=1 Tax=Limulus polyphemus TaxID=6850 RepID=A0ABM1THL7_LIMPO|nr:uncharacterized protein LOC106471040 isoform X1 [Limulus polyphemus]